MGPKAKKKPGTQEKIDEAEIVTEVMKQFFEIQIGDIKKKTERLRNTKQDLISAKNEIEEKITQFRSDKKTIINELKSQVEAKEDLKIEKRKEMEWLVEEIKNRKQSHENHIIELENRYQDMVVEIEEKTKELEGQVNDLEDFKRNKDDYWEKYNAQDGGIKEMQKEHLRTLYEIEHRYVVMKERIKKELESRLLQLSIEFQTTTESKLGSTAHRLIRENIAIENEVKTMEGTLNEIQEDYEKSKTQTRQYRYQHRIRDGERDRLIAKSIIQFDILQKLWKDVSELEDKMDEIKETEEKNEILTKKLGKMSDELKKQSAKKEDLKYLLDAKLEEYNTVNGKIEMLKRTFRRLQLVLRKSFRVAEEAKAVQLIPIGFAQEGQDMTHEAKLKAYQNRRDMVYRRKGKILIRLLNVLSRAKLDSEVKIILAEHISDLDFDIFDIKEGEMKEEEVEPDQVRLPSVVSGWMSDVSLPRSPSKLSEVMEEKMSRISAASALLRPSALRVEEVKATETKEKIETIEEVEEGEEGLKEETLEVVKDVEK